MLLLRLPLVTELVLRGLMYSIGSYVSVTVSYGISPAGINVQYRLMLLLLLVTEFFWSCRD